MKKRRSRLALLLAAMAAILLIPQAAVQIAHAATTSSATTGIKVPNGVKFNPKTAKCSTYNGVKHCVEFQRLPLKDLTTAQRAQRQRMMAEAAQRAKQHASASPSAVTTTPSAECGFLTDHSLTYTAHPTRFVSCDDILTTVQDWEIVGGAPVPVGTFEFEDQQSFTFSASSTSWVHDMETIGIAGIGDLTGGVNGTLYSNCYVDSGACIATSTNNPDPQTVDITPASTQNFAWNEEDAGSATTTAGGVDTLDSALGIDWTLDVAGGPQSTSETGIAGRCDDAAQTDNGDPGDDSTTPPVDPEPGCVDESYIPTLYLSLAQYGAAAQFIQWAQINLSGHWGLDGVGQPLHRLIDETLQANNREIICETDWTPDSSITTDLAPYNDKDSCDEYPFASTYESGAMEEDANGTAKPYVTTGANCAQLTAVQTGSSGTNEAQDWATTRELATPTGSEPCVRSHNPLKRNSGVGGAYSSFAQSNRLIDKDPFWVSVTS